MDNKPTGFFFNFLLKLIYSYLLLIICWSSPNFEPSLTNQAKVKVHSKSANFDWKKNKCNRSISVTTYIASLIRSYTRRCSFYWYRRNNVDPYAHGKNDTGAQVWQTQLQPSDLVFLQSNTLQFLLSKPDLVVFLQSNTLQFLSFQISEIIWINKVL